MIWGVQESGVQEFRQMSVRYFTINVNVSRYYCLNS